MKKTFKYIYSAAVVAALALTASSCTESMDTEPQGSTLTKGELESNASSLDGLVKGMYSNMIQAEAITSWVGATRHYDFGYASTMMMMDNAGQDEVSPNSGYNWYRNNLRFNDRTDKSDITYFLWNQQYKNISQANAIISATESSYKDNSAAAAARGKALAMRAFCYLNLAQMYQFTYKGHEDALCVPIVKETTTAEQASDNPRATVKDVYDFIMDDLNNAVTLLNGASRSGKADIDQQVAYGLRARTELVMQNWKAAADDAAKAAEGYTPLSREDAAQPGFNDISASNWIWGMDVNETSDIVQTGILNFPSMMSSFTGNGYSPSYAYRAINSKLWNEIPSTDVRKGWWLDSKFNSPIVNPDYLINTGKQVYVFSSTSKDDDHLFALWKVPYLNVKFGAYQNKYGNETNACDVPLMRVEEMILIQAEATAMSGDVAGGKKILEDFVRTYRDPDYTCNATTAEGVQDAVWFQRRVELWGEGFSYFDIMRLKKPIDRRGANYEASVTYDIPAESKIMLWIIPEDEVNNNKALQGKNNEIVAVPTPVK
jgi:hypothetical protein